MRDRHINTEINSLIYQITMDTFDITKDEVAIISYKNDNIHIRKVKKSDIKFMIKDKEEKKPKKDVRIAERRENNLFQKRQDTINKYFDKWEEIAEKTLCVDDRKTRRDLEFFEYQFRDELNQIGENEFEELIVLEIIKILESLVAYSSNGYNNEEMKRKISIIEKHIHKELPMYIKRSIEEYVYDNIIVAYKIFLNCKVDNNNNDNNNNDNNNNDNVRLIDRRDGKVIFDRQKEMEMKDIKNEDESEENLKALRDYEELQQKTIDDNIKTEQQYWRELEE